MRTVSEAVQVGLKFIRFGLVAGASTGLYAAVTALAIAYGGLDAKLASVVGYLSAMPLNFIGHRQFTFLSDGAIGREITRFVILHACNIAASVGAMAVVVDALGFHYLIGILSVTVLVPILTFVMLNSWVFQNQRR